MLKFNWKNHLMIFIQGAIAKGHLQHLKEANKLKTLFRYSLSHSSSIKKNNICHAFHSSRLFAISQDVKNMFSNMRVNSWTILWSNIKSSFSWCPHIWVSGHWPNQPLYIYTGKWPCWCLMTMLSALETERQWELEIGATACALKPAPDGRLTLVDLRFALNRLPPAGIIRLLTVIHHSKLHLNTSPADYFITAQ